MFVLAVGGVSDWWGHRDGVRPLAVVAGGSVFCCVAVLCFGVGIKQRSRGNLRCSGSVLRGGYLLSHFRSTIGAVRLNFSVRNGKRWNPHTITT